MNAIGIHRFKFTAPLAMAIIFLPFSVTLCHLGCAFFILAWLLDGSWKDKRQAFVKNQFVVIFLALFLLHLIGVFYSADKQAAWFGIEKKISLLVLPFLLATVSLQKEDVVKLLNVFVTTCLLATVICLWTALDKTLQASSTFNFDSYTAAAFYLANGHGTNVWEFLSYIELASGIGIHPSYFSLYLCFCFFLIIHFYTPKLYSRSLIYKAVLLFILFYLAVFIIFLSSRIMIFALLIISFYGLTLLLKNSTPLILIAGSVLFIFLFFGIIYLNPVSRFRNYQEIISTWPYLKPGLQTQSTTIRASLWSLSINSIPKINWLVGAGTGDVEHIIMETGKTRNISNVLGTNDPHNQYLFTLLGLGIVGLTSLLLCFIWPIVVSYKTRNVLYLGFIFLFSVLCLTETAMELQKGVVFFSLLGSLILFQHETPSIAN